MPATQMYPTLSCLADRLSHFFVVTLNKTLSLFSKFHHAMFKKGGLSVLSSLANDLWLTSWADRIFFNLEMSKQDFRKLWWLHLLLMLSVFSTMVSWQFFTRPEVYPQCTCAKTLKNMLDSKFDKLQAVLRGYRHAHDKTLNATAGNCGLDSV